MLLRAADLWREPVPRAPPSEPVADPVFVEHAIDYEYFHLN